MTNPKLIRILLIFLQGILLSCTLYAQSDEQQIRVAMRRIGHKVLLQSGDNTSRVLPISKESNRYRIRFASSFLFNPTQLVPAIDSVLRESNISRSYLVEIEQCRTGEIVYSYAIQDSIQPDKIPCLTRMPLKDCYSLFITLPEKATEKRVLSRRNSIVAGSVLSLFVFFCLLAYFRKKKNRSPNEPNDPEILIIGLYRFDRKNLLLSFGNEQTELSGKEADLLSLLYAHENTTLAREHLLKVVWGDEGDYIGRTLDVFISRLRRKLEADPRVKIVNIRGVGYRLIVN